MHESFMPTHKPTRASSRSPRFLQRGEGSGAEYVICLDSHPFGLSLGAETMNGNREPPYGRVILSGFINWWNSSSVRYPSFSAASSRLVLST